MSAWAWEPPAPQQLYCPNHEDHYHHYQVVVPEPIRLSDNPNPSNPNNQSSIQRLVGTLFSPAGHEPGQQSASTLVSQEPLIRSSSWQNKTLINLSAANPMSRRQAMELSQLEQQQQDHYYCALGQQQQQQQLYANQQLHLRPLAGAFEEKGAPMEPATMTRQNKKKKKRPPGAARQCLLLALLAAAAAILLLVLLLASLGQHQQRSNKLPLGGPTIEAATNKAPESPISAHEPVRLPPPAGQHQLHQAGPARPAPAWAAELSASPGGWRRRLDQEESQCRRGEGQFCGPKGRCDTDGLCYCQPGFSGPTCGRDDCASGCSQQGTCQLRPEAPLNRLLVGAGGGGPAALSSLGFASLSAAPARSSPCRRAGANSSRLEPGGGGGDQRLEWRCQCRLGFTGADCSRPQELQCSDGLDDDGDGLVDCDDDDCCRQAQCSANVMCFQSPEPRAMLDALVGPRSPLHQELQEANLSLGATANNHNGFYTQMRFLIGPNSTQSYAHQSALDRARLAVVRGRVVKADDGEGIMSVRVSVVNKVEYGFTLTRQDGFFDLLVNGSEWITLYFLRSGSPAKRKLFVRPLTINLLQQDVEMWLSSAGGQAADQQQQQLRQDSFELQLQWELNRWLRRPPLSLEPEEHSARRLRCLRDSARQHQQQQLAWNLAEPHLVSSTQDDLLLTTFVLANEGAFEARVGLRGEHSLLYNSAAFPPASSLVKPLLSIKLLRSSRNPPDQLGLIHLQLDIEGQSRREQLEPKRGLTYQFAWNRRNAYHQKVYGFGQLNLRLGYQYQLSQANRSRLQSAFLNCLVASSNSNNSDGADKLKLAANALVATLDRRVVWFERRLHLEGHQMNQQADLGKWALSSLNRYDPERHLLYLGSGRSLPFKLAYPPVVLTLLDGPRLDHSAPALGPPRRRHLSRGPNSVFAVVGGERLQQLEPGGRRRLIDLPLASLTGAGFGPTNTNSVEILYNNLAGMLYISSRPAAKILQVSYASLLVLNKTLVGHSPTAAPDDEIDIEPLAGFGQLQADQLARPARQVRLEGPHSMALDEERQLLYFVDGAARLAAIDLLTRRLLLLPVGEPSFDEAPPLCHLGARLPLADFRPHQIEALTWARSESSLMLLDRNMLYALRQDLWLELLATGSPSPCNAAAAAENNHHLGLISELAMDADDLLIAHQWTIDNGQTKSPGRFYLAKMRLGLGLGPAQARQPRPIFDLHSSQQTWDPMIRRLAASSNDNNNPLPIDWQPLARRPIQVAPGQSVHQQQQPANATVPFIHLLQGFRRLDSLETNTDGSIFALTDGGHSIKMIVAYSPNEFNSIERHDVNINRLFAANQQPPAESLQSQRRENQDDIGAAESTKLNVILLEQPITRQLLEFHGPSGLQLSSKTSLASNGSELKSSEFYYRILTNNKMIELDEDDKYDFQAQKLILNYMWHTGNLKQNLNHLSGTYVRLNKILDSNRNEYELQRLYTGSRFVLQSIQFNRQPLCEVATDYQGLLTTYQPLTTGNAWLELVYDGQTYLLRDMVSKSGGSLAPLQPTGQLNTDQNHNSNKLKRIVYDELFHHYCDLFIVDAA